MQYSHQACCCCCLAVLEASEASPLIPRNKTSRRRQFAGHRRARRRHRPTGVASLRVASVGDLWRPLTSYNIGRDLVTTLARRRRRSGRWRVVCSSGTAPTRRMVACIGARCVTFWRPSWDDERGLEDAGNESVGPETARSGIYSPALPMLLFNNLFFAK